MLNLGSTHQQPCPGEGEVRDHLRWRQADSSLSETRWTARSWTTTSCHHESRPCKCGFDQKVPVCDLWHSDRVRLRERLASQQ
jgi:hypothetical protein